MLDHISLRVQDFSRAVAFYRAALAPIGYQVLMEFPDAAGLGEKGKPDLWIMRTDKPLNATHVAFTCNRSAVDAFHAAALAAGGADNGAPGLRADYHPHYYAAFVTDPEGNNVEVVCHEPPGAAPAKKAAQKKVARKPARKPAAKAKTKAKPAKRKPAKRRR
jgi:catechol 2,3-dioxygenase-like lactoylglutathione lyase family enzyme